MRGQRESEHQCRSWRAYGDRGYASKITCGMSLSMVRMMTNIRILRKRHNDNINNMRDHIGIVHQGCERNTNS